MPFRRVCSFSHVAVQPQSLSPNSIYVRATNNQIASDSVNLFLPIRVRMWYTESFSALHVSLPESLTSVQLVRLIPVGFPKLPCPSSHPQFTIITYTLTNRLTNSNDSRTIIPSFTELKPHRPSSAAGPHIRLLIQLRRQNTKESFLIGVSADVRSSNAAPLQGDSKPHSVEKSYLKDGRRPRRISFRT